MEIFKMLLSVSALVCFLLLLSPLNALHYVTKESQKTSSSNNNTARPVAARSPIECTLKCKNHPGGERTPFFSNDKECFCLENEKQEVESRVQSEGKVIEGSMYLKAGNGIIYYNLTEVITESKPEVSCKTIKEKYVYAKSGMYWIDLLPATKVYCDMDTDGGGWLRIGRLVLTSENYPSYKGGPSISTTNLTDLHRAATDNFLLSGKKFKDLQSIIGFTEYRAFCTKPYHRRINHAKFSSTNPISLPLFNYITNGTTKAPRNLCNALVFMPDDNSIAQNYQCFLESRDYGFETRLYMFVWWRDYYTAQNAWFVDDPMCDDRQNSPIEGTWLYYVK